MTRYLCPQCKDHPELMENLDCYFCKGKYVWKDSMEIATKKGKEALRRLAAR